MAIKRVEVFARQYRARIISITNEQAELIEHSTRGDACEGKGGERERKREKESLLIASSLLPPLASSTPASRSMRFVLIQWSSLQPSRRVDEAPRDKRPASLPMRALI